MAPGVRFRSVLRSPARALGRAALAFLPAMAPPVARAAEAPPAYQLEWSVGSPSEVPAGAATDAAGNVYVTQRGRPLVLSYTATGSLRFSWEISSSGCASPIGVDLDANGNTFVSDFGCSRLLKYDVNRTLVAVAGGAGSGDGRFLFPAGVARGPDGSLYVADTYNHRIQKFDANGGFLLKWGAFGSATGQFNTPFDVATDAAGNVYVLDSFNQRVQVFDASGGFLRAWGEPGFGSDKLLQPQGLDVDGTSNVYVADTGNNQIVKFGPTGERLAIWGSFGTGAGQMNAPSDVAVDGDGNVYVVDGGNRRIQKFAGPLRVSLIVEPRTINVSAGGKWVAAHIEPPAPYVPADIDVASLAMNGVAVDPGAPVDLTDFDGDGILELTARFPRVAIVATAAPGTAQLALLLTGTIAGRSLEGRDVVKLVGTDPAFVASDPEGIGVAGLGRGDQTGALAVGGITPNPVRAGNGTILWLRALGTGPALVEVIDLAGRRVGRMEVSGGGDGMRPVRLALERPLAPGVYLVRVTQGGNMATRRFAVLE